MTEDIQGTNDKILHVLSEGKLLQDLNTIFYIQYYGKTEPSKRNCWEEAPHLNNHFNSNTQLQNGIQLTCLSDWLNDELIFECDKNSVPKLLPSFTRTIADIHLYHLIKITLSDVIFYTWAKDLHVKLPDYTPHVIRKLYHSVDNRYLEQEYSNTDDLFSKALYLSLLEQLPEDHTSYFCIALRLSILYLRTKEYDKAEILLQWILNTLQTNVQVDDLIITYISLILAMVYRINIKYRQSLYCLQLAIDKRSLIKRRKDSLHSAVWMWLGEIYESLQLYLWAAECYLKCLSIIETSVDISVHRFVNIPQLYLNLAELFIRRKNTPVALQYYVRSFDEFHHKKKKLFMQTSTFTRDYQQAAIAIRIANILSEKF
jgi:hypothetical protein